MSALKAYRPTQQKYTRFAYCDEEEALCLKEYEYKRKQNNTPEDMFIQIDIPLTLVHQFELMKNAGFKTVEVLYQNCGTVIIRVEK